MYKSTHDDDRRKIIRQISLWDQDTGELVASYTPNKGTPMGEGWFTMYKEQTLKLLESGCPPSTLKVFLKLCCMQSYDAHIYASRQYLRESLGITRKTLWIALKWLIENDYILEEEINGQNTFVINPKASNCGRSAIGEKQQIFDIRGRKARLSLTGALSIPKT